jgi:hypothetical protein
MIYYDHQFYKPKFILINILCQNIHFLTKVATDFKSFSFRARMVTPVVKLSKSDEKGRKL